MPKVESRISRTFSFAIGAQKLGHPVPDSNFVSELNRALSQPTQRYKPLSCTFQYCPVKARSVSARRVMSNAFDPNCFRHSASLLTTLGTRTFCSRFPASENWTIVTSDSLEPASETAGAAATGGDFTEHPPAAP